MTEAQLQAAVVELAGYLGWLTYHTYDSRRSQAGFPDLVMARGGSLIFAELKSAKGKVSFDQQIWLNSVEEVGWSAPKVHAYLWRPTDWLNGTIEKVLRGD